VEKLLTSGKKVILIMPLLNVGFDVPQKWFENQLRLGQAISEWVVEATPRLTNSGLREEIEQLLRNERANPRLIMVDPQSVICDGDRCYLVRHGEANFRDTAHISNVNANQYRGLFDAAFASALHAGSESRD
jgi:hypothetical protein